ncbi:MAG: hypothetical protein M1812_001649 [Candelaria pacifica]|nr:MAG: hypothetical protein M1812_001649 [Candelaria pacifica]
MWGAGLISTEYANGLGRHDYYLPEAHLLDFTFYGWLDWQQTFLTLTFTKVSICLFLLRITSGKWLTFEGLLGQVSTGSMLHEASRDAHYSRPRSILHCNRFDPVDLSHFRLEESTDQLSDQSRAVCANGSGRNHRDLLHWSNTTQLAWRLPEVNIGIVCANAPILRPIYLALTGRLPARRKSSDIIEEAQTHEKGFQLSQDPGQRKWPSHSSGSGKQSGSEKESQGKAGGPLSSNNSNEIDLPIQINWRRSLRNPDKDQGSRFDGTETYLSSETGSSVTYMERHVDDRV